VYKHILVATDGSELSQAAARQAVSLAKNIGARITALYVKPPHPSYFYVDGDEFPFPPPSKFDELDEQEAQRVLGFVYGLCFQAGVECKKRSLTSDAVHEAIIDVANLGGCELICMASHGRRGLSALLLGSETSKVLTHSKIPVLVVGSSAPCTRRAS
jgi:nucleotide-binding universal stress UspA family protein